MTDLGNRLQARITAQNLIIEALLDAVVRAGLMDVAAVVAKLEQFATSPKASWLDSAEVGRVTEEVEGWSDMIGDLYLPQTESDPARSNL